MLRRFLDQPEFRHDLHHLGPGRDLPFGRRPTAPDPSRLGGALRHIVKGPEGLPVCPASSAMSCSVLAAALGDDCSPRRMNSASSISESSVRATGIPRGATACITASASGHRLDPCRRPRTLPTGTATSSRPLVAEEFGRINAQRTGHVQDPQDGRARLAMLDSYELPRGQVTGVGQLVDAQTTRLTQPPEPHSPGH